MKQSKKKYFKVKKIPLSIQIIKMRELYPSFEFRGNEISNKWWVGQLRPTPLSPTYTVKIEYYQDNYPKVFIIYPHILSNAPHRYSDGSLCLFYPKDNSFKKDAMIAESIVPWTAEWLYFYEVWLKEGVWWGKEAPHELSSKRAQKIISKYNVLGGRNND